MTQKDANRLFQLTGICIYGIRNDWKVTLRSEFTSAADEQAARLGILNRVVSSWHEQAAADTAVGVVRVVSTADPLHFLCGEDRIPTGDPLLLVVGPFFSEGSVTGESAGSPAWPRYALRTLSRSAVYALTHEIWPDAFVEFGAFRQEKPSSSKFTSAQLDVLEADKIEYNNSVEFRLLYLISHGMTELLFAFLEEHPSSGLPKHIKNYGLRTKQDLTIVHNSLFCRAAISGGLPALYARSICSYYLDQIEQAENEQDLDAIRKKCACHYCSKLHESRQQAYGTLVRNVLSYLQVNLHNAPMLNEISARMGVSPEHLSRTIKSETGKSFTQILTKLRVDEAGFYLAYTQMPIWEVASLVGYSGSTTFGQMFKKATGLSPLRWREQKSSPEITPLIDF